MPALKCIDQYGAAGELHEDSFLTERDFSWLQLEEQMQSAGASRRESAPEMHPATTGNLSAVLRPAPDQRLTLDELRAWGGARSLIIDMQAAAGTTIAAATTAAETAPVPVARTTGELPLLPRLSTVAEAARAMLLEVCLTLDPRPLSCSAFYDPRPLSCSAFYQLLRIL